MEAANRGAKEAGGVAANDSFRVADDAVAVTSLRGAAVGLTGSIEVLVPVGAGLLQR